MDRKKLYAAITTIQEQLSRMGNDASLEIKAEGVMLCGEDATVILDEGSSVDRALDVLLAP